MILVNDLARAGKTHSPDPLRISGREVKERLPMTVVAKCLASCVLSLIRALTAGLMYYSLYSPRHLGPW